MRALASHEWLTRRRCAASLGVIRRSAPFVSRAKLVLDSSGSLDRSASPKFRGMLVLPQSDRSLLWGTSEPEDRREKTTRMVWNRKNFSEVGARADPSGRHSPCWLRANNNRSYRPSHEIGDDILFRNQLLSGQDVQVRPACGPTNIDSNRARRRPLRTA